MNHQSTNPYTYNTVGQPELATQERVLKLFQQELGYRFLGNRMARDNNSNIEADMLDAYLLQRGYTAAQCSNAIGQLRREVDTHNRTLYESNEAVYKLLRYGIKVKTPADERTETVHVIDWHNPTANDFVVVEEVTLRGNQTRRPDIVLYVNGIALAVLELKSSRVSINDGIRQNISNWQPEFNEWFFRTVQFVFAGNDAEGLRYGAVGTEEKYFLTWKEDEADNTRYKLDKYLLKLCRKDRFLEIIHDFVLFDAGVKKLPRVHQYFGIKAAQERIDQRLGGVIWHTQGSGKSIVMVLLAKWLLENNPHARVVIITDRKELDEQIERIFRDAGEAIYRTTSGRKLMETLTNTAPRLLCSLVHKFGRTTIEMFANEFEDAQPQAVLGDIFVFVDECHRTQSGKLHRAMKQVLPDAIFIGFTGTPLLKRDKQTSQEVFGSYIHTYKFSQAVADNIILDLVYEARDIDQRLGSQERIDAWFEAKTRGLNDWQKEALRKKWGTMQKVLSSQARMDRVVTDINFDFALKPRLSDGRGNAILVAASIYEACRYFTLFQASDLKDN
ncbi:MAG: HsdR family type I site-specific deoxyribonuclease, partial [Chloroflexota bacterium]